VHELEADFPFASAFPVYADDATFSLRFCFIIHEENRLAGLHNRRERDQTAVNVHRQGLRYLGKRAVVAGSISIDEHRHG
jgi:hypothetical protein